MVGSEAPENPRLATIVIVAMAAVSVGLTLAYLGQYATTNQATYLLDPLHRAMPELFHRDWFVSETPPYLPVFGWLTQWLYVVDPEGPTAVLVAHVVVNLATYAAIYWLVTALGGGWRAFLVVACFVTATMGISMGGSYLLAGYLQPSSLATLGWIVGMAALVRDRYLVCGLAVAAAGALHANYLVLGVGLFGLAAFARRDLSLRDHAMVIVPQLVVLAVFAPSLAQATGPTDEAVWILTHFHAPVHYAGIRLVGWIPDVVAWQLGAFAALQLLPGDKAARVLWRFSLVAFGVITVSAFVIRFSPFESLTQVRWSRIAPFGQLACLTLIVCALVQQAARPRELSLRTRVLVGLGIAAPLIETGLHVTKLISWPALGIAAALAGLVLVPRPRIARTAIVALAALALVQALWASPRGRGLTTTPLASTEELELARWAQDHTAVDALFLIPPSEYRFRLLARRAIVIDTKSPPLRPDLLVAWYHRLCASVLLRDAPTFEATEARYQELTAPELERVAHTFDADYVVVTAPTKLPTPPAFENAGFRVYRVR